jgi:hypothetical protein
MIAGIKLRRERWAEHVAHMERMRVFVENNEVKRHPEDQGLGWSK